MRKFILFIFCIFCCSAFAQNYEKTAGGVKSTVGDASIEIQFYSSKIVRVVKSPAGTAFKKNSLSVIKQPESTPLKYAQYNNILQIRSEALCVTLNLQTGSVAFNGLDNRPLLAEKEYTSVIANCEERSRKQSSMDSSGLLHSARNDGVSQTFLMDKQEAIYGLGQQQDGVMNGRNHAALLKQENMKVAIPFFQSVKGYGLFWDNYSATQFTDNDKGTTFASETGAGIDYYFLYGGTMDGTIACMRELTGQVPLYPLWTWGYWQSRERYASQKELVETVKKYRELQVPLDGIVQDWQYWSTDNAYWNGIEFKNPEFPQPAQMVKDIHTLNAHTIISVWPSFGVKTQPYKAFKEKGLLFGFESFPQPDSVRVYNAYSSKARDMYWDFLNKYLFSIGIDGWWLDATEPEYSNITGQQLNASTGLGAFRDVRNAFPLLTVGGVYDHQRKVNNDKRVYILTRSAFAGQQRYAANVWSGDIDGDWETLRKQIPAGLNYSLCGLPYWNTDIGGFWVRNSSSADAGYRELYVRWLQFGAFMPAMRSHGTNTPREIWQFGQKGDWAYDAIEKYIRLRYRLLPYHYSLSWNVTSQSGSIMRALAMDFPKDKKVWDMGTEYLYGKSFLVVPVTQPASDFSQTQTVPVYLPKGADWYDFQTNEKFAGGTELQRQTPVDWMPLFVKAGSIIPFGSEVQYANAQDWQNLELKIYPGADAEFVLYEDERDNYNYEKGAYSTIRMLWNDAARTFTVEDRQGAFPGMKQERTFNITITGETETKKADYKGQSIRYQF